MKYPREYIEEIKNRIKVSSVVGKTVNLKKRGKEFIGLSPFKNEKTPSFTVNDEKGFFHCFSSSEHGNIFDFLMKTQNLKFGETVKILASEAGMRPYTFSKQDEEREKQWKIYSKILSEYKLFYHNELKNNPTPELRDYLSKRGILEKEINNFKIGYVPKYPSFYEKISKQYSEKEIMSSGLFYLDERNKKYIERFKDRLIFPINALNGSTIAFGGRTISNNKNTFAKYINSPETLFFKKGNNLFNLDVARKYSNENEDIFLVEGYMDVLSLNKENIMNTVANLGTALTETQIQLLWRFFNNIIICFDGDQGGKDAAVRAADKLIEIIKPDSKISFLFLPISHDPDSFINKFGREYFLKYTKNKVSIHEFIWNHHSENINTKEPSSMANFEKTLKQKFNSIKDFTVRKYTLEYFYDKLSQLTPITNFKKKNFKFSLKSKPLKQTKDLLLKKQNYDEIELKEFSILYLIINNLDIFEKKIELIAKLNLYSPLCKEFLKKIVNYLADGDFNKTNFNNLEFVRNDFADLINKINILTPIKFILKIKKKEEDLLKIYEEMVQEISKFDISHRIEFLEKKLIDDMNNETFQELLDLKNQVNQV
jgi:DNA primase